MDSKEIVSLWEAYASVYAPQEEEVGVEEVSEADSLAAMQARREKRLAAQRKREGTTASGRDFGHDYSLSADQQKKRRDAEFKAGIGTKKEEVEVEVDEAMRPGPRREKMRAKMYDPYVRGGSKSRGQAHNIAVRGDVSTGDPAIKSRGGGGVKKDKGMGYGDRGAGNKARRRAGQEPLRGNTRKEELDIFDTVLEYLQVEGIAESLEDAQWVMVNVLDEEDIDSILDEARRADKEGYARDTKQNPKRKDMPHGDVSQRSMLHSKLKRRAYELGAERRSSARNKAGGRTPVGKKEKAFLQAADRTRQYVRNPNVPDTGKHKK